MKTQNLRINQLTSNAFDWYVAYLESLDAKNIGLSARISQLM